VSKVYGLKIKLMMATMQDQALDKKLNQLLDDYTALVKGESAQASTGKAPSAPNSAEATTTGEEPAAPAPSQMQTRNPEELKAQLLDVLGDNTSWKSKALASLKENMTCDEVRALFRDLEECKTTSEFDFPEASSNGHPIIARYKFSFRNGKLYDATIIFKRSLDREQFKAVSLELFDRKWGGIKPDEREKDILTSIGPNFAKAQRSYMMNEWQITHDFPKE
jgi:hypothetical protein